VGHISPATSPPAPITVLVVDDNAAVRTALDRMLRSHPGVSVVALVGSAGEAVAVVGELRPAVTVLDVSMPVRGGLSTVAMLKHLNPAGRVVMYSLHDEPAYKRAAFREGADGYVTKDDPGGLLTAICA
jgi:two-component system, NarL family, invasion response regulator UvrY